jgi:hypothetical protein
MEHDETVITPSAMRRCAGATLSGMRPLNTSLSITVGRPAPRVYDFLRRPENLSRWAAHWIGEPAHDAVSWCFTEPNQLGVLDFAVRQPCGTNLYVPLRVVAHAEGCTLVVTLFRRPGVSDTQFAAAAERVKRDLVRAPLLLDTPC